MPVSANLVQDNEQNLLPENTFFIQRLALRGRDNYNLASARTDLLPWTDTNPLPVVPHGSAIKLVILVTQPLYLAPRTDQEICYLLVCMRIGHYLPVDVSKLYVEEVWKLCTGGVDHLLDIIAAVGD